MCDYSKEFSKTLEIMLEWYVNIFQNKNVFAIFERFNCNQLQRNFNKEPRHKLWASVVIAGTYICWVIQSAHGTSVWSLIISVILCNKNFRANWHRSYRLLFSSWICWKCSHDDEVTSTELKSYLSRALIINNVRFLWWSVSLDPPKGHFSERPLSSYTGRSTNHRSTDHFHFQLFTKRYSTRVFSISFDNFLLYSTLCHCSRTHSTKVMQVVSHPKFFWQKRRCLRAYL